MDKLIASQPSLLLIFLVFFALFGSTIAPLPPCTPFLWVNKMVESNNWSSDMNPYYPVKPCPYRDPDKAPLRMRFAIFSGPRKLMYHIGTEIGWFFTKGFPRAARMIMGREKFRVNPRILREGHQRHYTRNPRTRQFGHQTFKTKQYYRNRRRRKLKKP